MNELRIVVGEKFCGRRSRVPMEIIGFDRDEAIIREIETGYTFHYCVSALKRAEMEPIREGA